MKYKPAERPVSDKPKRRWFQFSRRVPTFCLCFAVAFGVLALVRVWRRRVVVDHFGRVADVRLIVANAYLTEQKLPWQETLVAHTVAATVLGAAATIVFHLKSRNHRVARTFGIKGILILTFLCGICAALLRHVEVHPLVLVCAMFPVVAYPITCFIAVKLRPYGDGGDFSDMTSSRLPTSSARTPNSPKK